MHPVPYHLPLLEKGLGTHALAVRLLGPWIPCNICLFLVVVLGRCNRQGPIKNRHSKATQLPNKDKCNTKILFTVPTGQCEGDVLKGELQ
jgi:hypothetical protein